MKLGKLVKDIIDYISNLCNNFHVCNVSSSIQCSPVGKNKYKIIYWLNVRLRISRNGFDKKQQQILTSN